MTQMNPSTKQKQTCRHREQTCGCQGRGGWGEGWIGSLGLADANYLYTEWINNKVYCIAQGTISNILWYAIVEKNIKKCIYVYN